MLASKAAHRELSLLRDGNPLTSRSPPNRREAQAAVSLLAELEEMTDSCVIRLAQGEGASPILIYRLILIASTLSRLSVANSVNVGIVTHKGGR